MRRAYLGSVVEDVSCLDQATKLALFEKRRDVTWSYRNYRDVFGALREFKFASH